MTNNGKQWTRTKIHACMFIIGIWLFVLTIPLAYIVPDIATIVLRVIAVASVFLGGAMEVAA
jgi:MFS-type transporter involved in bile tolerance (Atg22 family)